MDKFATGQHSPPTKKRPLSLNEISGPSPKAAKLDVQGVHGPTSPASMDSMNGGEAPLLPNGTSRQASPALSLLSSLSSLTTLPSVTEVNDHCHSAGPPIKRRKLTAAEKTQKEKDRAEQKLKREEERLAKEEERRKKNELKEENRQKKELERTRKDEEKRLKDEEKEKQRRIKESEKQEKEAEQRRKEEAKEKKERAQTRLNSFFTRPSATPKHATTLEAISKDELGEKVAPVRELLPMEDVVTSQNSKRTDYERTFLPFHVGINSTCAPQNNFSWDKEAINHIENVVANAFRVRSEPHEKPDLQKLVSQSLSKVGTENYPALSVREIIAQISGHESTYKHIDLTFLREIQNPLDQLRRIPMKYIQFHQDVRPPYVGTYTQVSIPDTLRTARQPFRRTRADTNYDYDSEAEWEEPEDGEDLNSEGDSEDEPEDEDMAEFLDDEGISADNISSRKRFISGDLEPLSTGLCWENSRGRITSPTDGRPQAPLLKMEALLESISLPIDPLSTKYWSMDDLMRDDNLDPIESSRAPLQAHINYAQNAPSMNDYLNIPPRNRPTKPVMESRKILSGEDLEQFKRAVEGNDLPKVALLAILKKRFPKWQNAVLKETLDAVATRVGKTQLEKTWVLIETTKSANVN